MDQFHPVFHLLSPRFVALGAMAASCVVNGMMARRRNRNRPGWVLLGLLMPVISPLILMSLSFICTRCRARLCSREVQDGVCFACGKPLR